MIRLKLRTCALIALILCLPAYGCHVCQYKMSSHQCLEEQLAHILTADFNAKLHRHDELIFVIVFSQSREEAFRAALMPKEDYPHYLNFLGGKGSSPKGYFYHKGVIAITYGDHPRYLKLKPTDESMPFLIPAEEIEPEEGQPPFPPVRIDPVIYTYRKQDTCYKLIRSTVADALF
jgi:hypothetical protein